MRLVREARKDYPSLWSAVESIAPKIGCAGATLYEWVKRHEVDSGLRGGVTSAERERIKALEREVQGVAPGQRDPAAGARVFRAGGARPPQGEVRSFIDQYRKRFGVEPIRKMLRVAPSAYWRHAARQHDPSLRGTRTRRDDFLMPHIPQVWQANFQVYGADKVWRQLQREGIQIARRTVGRLMHRLGLRGVRRGNGVRTTFRDPTAPCPLDRINRQFKAERPNRL